MDSLHKQSYSLDELMPLIRAELARGRTVRFFPRGTSMLPMIRQGIDQVVISPVRGRLRKYDLPLYRRENGQYVLHRIVAVGETYTCMGDNQFTEETGLRHDQMIAVVTAFSRNGKDHKVTEFGYRCYCRFWHHSRAVRHFVRRACHWVRHRVN